MMNNKLFTWSKPSLLKVARHPVFIIGIVMLLFVLIITFFPDYIINTFFKTRITKAITEVCSADSVHLGRLHYNVWRNRVGCDSISLKTNDYTFSAAPLSLNGFGLLKIIRQSNFTPNTIANSEIDAKGIILYFNQSQQELRFGLLHISVPDSELVIDSIKYSPLSNDDKFFSKSRFRQTSYRIQIPQIQIHGMDCLAFLQSDNIIARKIEINEVSADILVNMDKPYDKSSQKPKMPNEILATMKQVIKIDSLKITNGKLKYCERFIIGTKPGIILINDINISAGRIANHTSRSDTTIILGDGLFMNTGKMKLFMSIPLESKDFSLRYSGSLSSMDVTELNSFIEPSENQRINSGFLKSARFNINVNAGDASGNLLLEYNNLDISFIDKNTGSEKGIFNQISSLFGKIFVIRKANTSDDKGLMKVGLTKYMRNPDDYFFQYVWFALRNGIADVVGFPPK